MDNQNKSKDIQQGFLRKIEKKEKRKLRARDKKYQAVWFGMGSFGVIGWSVMIPTVIGIAVGIWADKRWPGHISWTLTFLFLGLSLAVSMPGTGWKKNENRLKRKTKNES